MEIIRKTIMVRVNHYKKTRKTKYFYFNNHWPIFTLAELSARLENMFLNFLNHRHFIGQSEHVFKNNDFSLSRPPENLDPRIWLKTPIFRLETFEKKPYLLPATIRRTPGI
jgi:hypothetical protein